MTDTSTTYKRLVKTLNNTRKPLVQTCHELGIDIDLVEDHILMKHIGTCTHCDVWSTALILDLDDNPICRTCYSLVGA